MGSENLGGSLPRLHSFSVWRREELLADAGTYFPHSSPHYYCLTALAVNWLTFLSLSFPVCVVASPWSLLTHPAILEVYRGLMSEELQTLPDC